jgi:hypothetical protein
MTSVADVPRDACAAALCRQSLPGESLALPAEGGDSRSLEEARFRGSSRDLHQTVVKFYAATPSAL